jgi:hypothetical protein
MKHLFKLHEAESTKGEKNVRRNMLRKIFFQHIADVLYRKVLVLEWGDTLKLLLKDLNEKGTELFSHIIDTLNSDIFILIIFINSVYLYDFNHFTPPHICFSRFNRLKVKKKPHWITLLAWATVNGLRTRSSVFY